MESKEDLYKINKFDNINFGFYKTRMKDYLYRKDLYVMLEEKLKSMNKKEWNLV